jgi:hypothetical protein
MPAGPAAHGRRTLGGRRVRCYAHRMASFCRFVGILLLCISTVALAVAQYTAAIAGAVVGFVWLVVSQWLTVTVRQESRDP